MHQGMFAHAIEDGKVECRLCAHFCRLRPGQSGLCRVRHNAAGKMVTSTYGHPVLLGVEPIEKKYLFHVAPGSQTLSLATPGCNLGCQYCINWRVSQRGPVGTEEEVTPATIVSNALAHGVDCIAFTYTEPTIFFEYAQDIARLAQQAGLMVVAKSNGYMTPEVLQEMASWLDAVNIDLKGWRNEAHHRVVGGKVEPVLENLRTAIRMGLWLEVTTLIVPGLSDDLEDLENIARFIATELGPDTPWHLLRFFPHYKMLDQMATAQGMLQKAVDGGRKAGLRYIYVKELAHGQMLHTRCPSCQALVIQRKGYGLLSNNLLHGCCPQCGSHIRGVELNRKAAQAITHLEVPL